MFKSQRWLAGIKGGLLLLALILTGWTTQAQSRYWDGGVKIKLLGTSNIHDWDMNSGSGVCYANITIAPTGTITELNDLTFEMKVESLKSHDKTMDNNTYKQMNADKYPTIKYAGSSTSVTANGNNYTIVSKGKLTISGNTRDVELVGKGVMGADKVLKLNGTYKTKMTTFGVKPVSIMFGAIKTGDDISINYDLTLKAK
jgi:YceI-like domain